MSETKTELPPEPTWTLNALDRCDACGAQAYIQVTMKSGGSLLFCKHHGEKHRVAIAPYAREWVDESARLGERP